MSMSIPLLICFSPSLLHLPSFHSFLPVFPFWFRPQLLTIVFYERWWPCPDRFPNKGFVSLWDEGGLLGGLEGHGRECSLREEAVWLVEKTVSAGIVLCFEGGYQSKGITLVFLVTTTNSSDLFLCLSLCIYLSVYNSVSVSVSLSVSLSLCLSLRLQLHLSVSLPVCFSLCQTICLCTLREISDVQRSERR